MRRNIIVTSATGNQAAGLLRSFFTFTPPTPASSQPSTPLTPSFPIPNSPQLAPDGHEYHIYAVTRRSPSTSVRSLGIPRSEQHRLHFVQADLNDRGSVKRIFDDVTNRDGGVWGVFTILPFPGLGADASGEERMGKMMADLALQYGVKSYVYSSAMRLGAKYETKQYLKFSAKAKVRIEEYVRSLTEKGLPWTILQPGFFMENFEGFKGSLAVSILKKGLKPETTISFVAAEDVGRLAASILQDDEFTHHKTLLVVSEFVTLAQVEASYLQATGRPLPSAPKAVGWGLNKGSSKTRELMVAGLELNHTCRTNGDYPDLEEEMEKTKAIYELRSYHEWKSYGR